MPAATNKDDAHHTLRMLSLGAAISGLSRLVAVSRYVSVPGCSLHAREQPAGLPNSHNRLQIRSDAAPIQAAGHVRRCSFDQLGRFIGDGEMSLETWELLSYVVTVIGLPLAIGVFLFEQRKERENEEEEVYQLLSDNYQDFLKVALANPDLRLFSDQSLSSLNEEQVERQFIIFSMLISLFERAYLLLYEDDMTENQSRRWHSWEDYIREWCQKPHFRSCLPQLLRGEDPSFVRYVERLSASSREQ